MDNETDYLAKQNSEAIQLIQQLLTPSEVALSRELAITAGNAKIALTGELSDEFFRLFSGCPPEAIEWVFQTHRNTSDFWPSIRQVNVLFDEWEDRQRKEEKAELQQWTPEGLKLWHSILKRFNELCGNKPKVMAKDTKNTRDVLKAQAQSIAREKNESAKVPSVEVGNENAFEHSQHKAG